MVELEKSKRHDFEEKFNFILYKQFGVDKNFIFPMTRFKEDLGADSLDMAELTIEFEKEFEVVITDYQADQIATVEDAMQCLKNVLKKKPNSSYGSVI